MICGGRSWEGLYVLANSNPTAVGYWDKIFRPIVRPYAGAMSPGFRLCWTMLGLVWLKCPGWWGHWYHWLALTFLKDLNPIYSLRDFMYCCQITPQTVQEPWSRSGRRSPSKPSTVSSGEWPDVGSTYGQMGAIHTNEPDYEASWIRLWLLSLTFNIILNPTLKTGISLVSSHCCTKQSMLTKFFNFNVLFINIRCVVEVFT